jgi:hypothetical protein
MHAVLQLFWQRTAVNGLLYNILTKKVGIANDIIACLRAKIMADNFHIVPLKVGCNALTLRSLGSKFRPTPCHGQIKLVSAEGHRGRTGFFAHFFASAWPLRQIRTFSGRSITAEA